MKKTVSATLIFALLAAACQKEAATPDMISLRVTMENQSKMFLADNTPCWHDGDQFYINAGEEGAASDSDGGDCVINNIQEAEQYTAVFPKSIVSGTSDITSAKDIAVSIPRSISYEQASGVQKLAIPMVGLSEGSSTTMQFKNVGGLMKVVVSDLPSDEVLDSIVVSHNVVSLSGSGTLNNVRSANPELACSGSKEVALTFAEGSSFGNGTYLIPVPVIASRSTYAFTIQVYVHESETYVTKSYCRSQSAGNGYMGRNSIASVPFDVDDATSVPFDHYYFLTGYSQKVEKTSGNMKWNFISGRTVFHSNQYDHIGRQMDFNGSYLFEDTEPNTAWGDLLPWGVDLSALNINFLDADDFYKNGSAFYEWGSHSSISDQGCFTLSWSEWQYLLAHSRHAGATVNGMGGVVILPRNWEGCPDGCAFSDGYVGGYSTNTYTSTQWGLMEARGAMFLPARGYGYMEGISLNTMTETRSGEVAGYWLRDNARYCLKVDPTGLSRVKVENLATEELPSGPGVTPHFDETYICSVRLMKRI